LDTRPGTVPKRFDRIFPKPGDENLTEAAARALAIPDD
jgi:hypothetical protein